VKNPFTNHPLAFCPVHGIFPATGFAFSSGAEFVDCRTDCFVRGCPSSCEVISGKYDATAYGLNILIDPSISRDALEAIKTIALKMKTGAITPQQASEEVSKIAPQVGGLFQNWTRAEAIALATPLIAALTAIIVARSSPSPSTTITIQPVIERTIERGPDDWRGSSSLSRVPLPKPRPKQPK
jgi:hypothetical protein